MTIHSVTQRRGLSWCHWEVNLPGVTPHGGLNTPDHVAWGVDTAGVTQTRIWILLESQTGMETFLVSHTGMCTLMVSLKLGGGHSWGHTDWGENDTGDYQ